MRAPSSPRRPLRLRSIAFFVSVTATVVAAAGALTACPESACPYPRSADVRVEPAMPCLQVAVESCLHPTLELRNQCEEALYVPTEYGLFTDDVREEPEIEIRSKQNVIYEIRKEKAVSTSRAKEDYAIPVRVGLTPLTISFSTLSED